MIEIERKFLVKDTIHEVIALIRPHQIIQAYLVNEKSKSVRVRIMDEKAFLTIKSDMIGITRKEYEYEIPVIEALSLIKSFGLKSLKKKRYKLEFRSKTWEIDVFEGALQGLILAEIELDSEDEKFDVPEWVDEEVTFKPEFLNARLINRL
ncbi:CYTH domain-containing protein [bacterium]|nr:CYTH domain-containing protein [Flavobacteriales bacterium]MDA9020438.1 CYTH domain-containing protein [bacterium]MDC0460031.1 CYTH domain-containing protein [Crocinitomicaceae bacterium]